MLAHNRGFARGYVAGEAPARPRKRLAVVLCMDARIDPFAALGLKTGDAHILRNAGGRIVDALRSLVISQTQLGTREVAIIHHTECGMMTFRDDDIRATIRADLGADASHVAFLPFRDLEESIRDDLAYYRQQPLLRQDIPVRGFVYDVGTGLLREVLETS
jgi:carbonic anhydrase